MTRGNWYLGLGFFVLALWWASGSKSFADTPKQQVKETVDAVIEILQKGESRGVERRELLRRALLPRFDFAEMARRSLGSHWRGQPGRQEEFVSAFTSFVENSYMSTLDSYKGEKIVYARERVDQGFAEVDTRILPGKGEAVSVNYRLYLVGGEWKIYDVVIENISMVNNYRAQFNRILSTASFDELLRKLREKGSERGS